LIKYIVKIKQFDFCVERYIRRQEGERYVEIRNAVQEKPKE
jgi:hypothetical protein